MGEMIHIAARGEDEEQWNVIIETPKGSCNKYKYDDELRIFTLAHALPDGLAFPFDFGFLPSTRGEDGDPLDVLLLMDQPTFSGCLIPARLIGVIEAQQKEKGGERHRNDRLLAVPLKTRRYENVQSAKDLEKRLVEGITRFFTTYNDEAGKEFTVLDMHGPQRAEKLAEKGMKEFAARHRRRRRKA